MAGQTINDRLLAARHSLAGQGLAKSVCKATTEEMIAPKKKHLDCKCQTYNICWSVTDEYCMRFWFALLVNWVLTLFQSSQTLSFPFGWKRIFFFFFFHLCSLYFINVPTSTKTGCINLQLSKKKTRKFLRSSSIHTFNFFSLLIYLVFDGGRDRDRDKKK